MLILTGGVDTDIDTVELVGLNADDVTLRRLDSAYWDLQIIIDATGETLTVQSHYWPQTPPADKSIERIEFADGSDWDKAAIAENAWLTGTSSGETLNGDSGNNRIFGDAGDDTLGGNGGDDTFDGGAGNDTIWGDGGSNTILFGAGSGNDLVRLDGGTDSDVDTVELVGLNADDVTLRRYDSSYWDLEIVIDATGETLTVQSHYWPQTPPADKSIEKIVFADQTEWDKATIAENAWLTGSSGGETLNGDSGNNRIFGDAGDDTLGGNGGNDVLKGGAGIDTLWGGTGADDFISVYDGSTDIVGDYAAADGDRVSGDHYTFDGSDTHVFDASDNEVFTLENYDASTDGITFL